MTKPDKQTHTPAVVVQNSDIVSESVIEWVEGHPLRRAVLLTSDHDSYPELAEHARVHVTTSDDVQEESVRLWHEVDTREEQDRLSRAVAEKRGEVAVVVPDIDVLTQSVSHNLRKVAGASARTGMHLHVCGTADHRCLVSQPSTSTQPKKCPLRLTKRQMVASGALFFLLPLAHPLLALLALLRAPAFVLWVFPPARR